MLELSSVGVNQALRPLCCRTTVRCDIFAESLYVFEPASGESRLDYFHPGADTIYLLSHLFPLQHPGTVDPIASGRPGHSVEAFEVMSSFEFFIVSLVGLFNKCDGFFFG